MLPNADPSLAKRVLAHDAVLFVFDGVDEIPSDRQLAGVSWLARFIERRQPGHRILVTARYLNYATDALGQCAGAKTFCDGRASDGHTGDQGLGRASIQSQSEIQNSRDLTKRTYVPDIG